MDGIFFLHNQAGEALMRAQQTIAELRAEVTRLSDLLEAEPEAPVEES